MSEYLMKIWIPGTEYSEIIIGEEINVENMCDWWAERFAVMYGWEHDLFIDDDNATSKNKECEIKYNEILVLFSNSIKYKVYEMIDSNTDESGNIHENNIVKFA